MLSHQSYRSTGLSDADDIVAAARMTAEQFAAEQEEAFGPAGWTPESIAEFETWLAAQSAPTDAQRLEALFREFEQRDAALAELLETDTQTLNSAA